MDIIAIDYGWSEARENWHFGTLSSYPKGAKWCGKAVFFEILVDLNYDYATLQFGNIQFICHKKCTCIKPVRFFFLHFILFS